MSEERVAEVSKAELEAKAETVAAEAGAARAETSAHAAEESAEITIAAAGLAEAEAVSNAAAAVRAMEERLMACEARIEEHRGHREAMETELSSIRERLATAQEHQSSHRHESHEAETEAQAEVKATETGEAALPPEEPEPRRHRESGATTRRRAHRWI